METIAWAASKGILPEAVEAKEGFGAGSLDATNDHFLGEYRPLVM